MIGKDKEPRVVSPHATRGRIPELIATAGLAILAFIGYIKAAPIISSFPVDLTFFGAAIVALAILVSAPRLLAMRGIAPLILIYLALLVGAVPVGVSTEYSSSKVLRVLLLVPICLLGARIILRTDRARTTWLQIIVLLGFIIAALTILFPDDIAAESGRLTIADGNSIGSARGVGAAVTVLMIWALHGKRRRWISVAAAAVLVLVMLLIGTRGPLLAAAAAVTASTFLSRANKTPVRPLLAILAVGSAAWIAVTEAEKFSGRLFTLQDDSADARRALWADTLRILTDNPLGIGWGQLAQYLRPGYSLESGAVQYPHNLILEIFVEAGWLSGALIILALGWAAWIQTRASTTPVETAMLALLIFSLVSALVSGDVTSNREVWVAVGATMAWAGRRVPTTARDTLDGDLKHRSSSLEAP